MPNEYSNGAVKAKDKDNNYVRFRGGSDKDWEKIRRGLEQIGYLTEAVEHLKEYALAGGSIGGGGGGGGSADVDDASNTRKGITYLTDDPNANKNAATGVTAVTPKALQIAINDLKEQIINGDLAPSEPEEPEPDLGEWPLPDEPGFGVGVAPKDVYESLGLKPLPGTEDPNSFQYGLYEATAPDDSDDTHIQTYHAYLKYIPKYYHCLLSTDVNTLMGEAELKELEPYTGMTVAQMQEAQRRGGTSAIALAPASVFENEADANAHGFILNRGYYDDGKEKPGFFIANTLAVFFQGSDAAGNTEIQYYCGMPSYKFKPQYKYTDSIVEGMVIGDSTRPEKLFGVSAKARCVIDLGRKFTGLNCISIGMWQVICMLCYAAGLYCKDNSECGWYADGYNACPCGINTRGVQDERVPEVTVSPSSTYTVWTDSEKYYNYTTHSGRIHGITNCNGWGGQLVLGISYGSPNYCKLMNISGKLSSLNEAPAAFDDVASGVSDATWGEGGFRQPFSYLKEHTAAWYLSFALPLSSDNDSNPTEQFGGDAIRGGTTHKTIYATGISAGSASDRESGIFARYGYGSNTTDPTKLWNRSRYNGCRIGGYPEV